MIKSLADCVITDHHWRRGSTINQSGALSLVGRVEILLSLVESFIQLKYFHGVATPALLCHKEPARRIQSPLLGALERTIPTLHWGGILLDPRWFFMA